MIVITVIDTLVPSFLSCSVVIVKSFLCLLQQTVGRIKNKQFSNNLLICL